MKMRYAFFLLAGLHVLPGPGIQGQACSAADRRAEYVLVSALAEEILPRVCELAGFDRSGPVPIEVWNRSELRAP